MDFSGQSKELRNAPELVWKPRLLRHQITWFASSRFGSWLFSRLAHHVDWWVFQKTRGRKTLSSILTGLPIIILTSIGRRSGRIHKVPLLGVPLDQKIILIASNWGGETNPAWYYNLKTNPAAMVSFNDKNKEYIGTYIAQEVYGVEREKYWNLACDIYPGYLVYKQRAGDRYIPVLILEPKE